MPMPSLTPAEADAISRFELGGRRPQLEAWYVKVALGGGRAIQLRIGLIQRVIGKKEARAEVWVAVTGLSGDPGQHLALRTHHAMGEVRIEREIHRLDPSPAIALLAPLGDISLTGGKNDFLVNSGNPVSHGTLKSWRCPASVPHGIKIHPPGSPVGNQ